MKDFQTRSSITRWAVALLLLAAFMVLCSIALIGTVAVFGWSLESPLQLCLAMGLQLSLLLPFWMMAGIFFVAPLLRLLGTLRYYSPYLVVTRSRDGHLDLHGATLFDYLLLFRWSDRGRQAVRQILIWYVDGLLAIIREIEQGKIQRDTIFSATSYIFSESIARRYGFRVEASRWFSIGGFLTLPTQFVTYSFAKGHWALPPILRARRATIDGTTLCAQSARLQMLRWRLVQPQQREHMPASPRKQLLA